MSGFRQGKPKTTGRHFDRLFPGLEVRQGGVGGRLVGFWEGILEHSLYPKRAEFS